MAYASKGRVIHRETFQNSNQLVEVLIRTKPKLTTVGAPVKKKSTFKRNCPLKNQLDQITEESNPPTNQHHQKVSGSNRQATQNSSKKLSSDMVVEVSKSKRSSRKKSLLASPDRTWNDVFKSYSSIRGEESINESTSSNACADNHNDHIPSKGPKTRDGFTQANRSVQTSQFLPRSKEYSVKAFQLDRPSFTDKETTVPLHMQVLSENFENAGQNHQALQNLLQSQQERVVNLPPEHLTSNYRPQTGFPSSGNLTNAAVHQERVDKMFPASRQENTRGQIPTAEEARLLSDGLSSTPFSDSALQLLQQLRQKLHLRGDSESSEMLGVLEQFLVSGAPAGRRQQHPSSSPDRSLYNTVFNTPAAPSGDTIGHPQPDHLHQHQQQPHQLPHVSYQPHTEYRHYAAHAQQQPHGPGSVYQAPYTQQRLSPLSGEPTEVPPQYVEQLKRQLSEQQLVAQQQAATIGELRSLSSRLLALHGKTAENPAFQPTKNTAVQTTQKPAVKATQVLASSASSSPSPFLSTAATAYSSLQPSTHITSPSPHLQPSHAAQPDIIAPQWEVGSSKTTTAAPITQHPCHTHHAVTAVQKEQVYPLAAAVSNGSRGASNTRGVTFGSLPPQAQLQGTDRPNTTADSIIASDRVLENDRGNRCSHELPLSNGSTERYNLNSNHINRSSPPHCLNVEQGRLPDQLPSAGWGTADLPGDRRRPIPLPPARGVPSASSADDRMQRAALWSMHCENEMLKRQLREARQPAQSSCVATTAGADANPSTSSSPADLIQQQPLTSTRRSPPVTQPPDDHVGDSDSAFDERTSSKLGSKRPSPSVGDGAPHLLGLSSVPHAVPHSDSGAFRVTNTLPTNAQGFGGTRLTFRSTAPLANVAATGVDTDMLRTTRERQQTTLNPSVCNASTIPNTVLRDRQQPSPLGSPPSSSVGQLASNTSCTDKSVDRSMIDLNNPNYMNLYLSAVGHVPSRLHEVEQHSEVLLSTLSALSEDEQSLAPNASYHYESNYNSGTIETSTLGERFLDSKRESARPVAKFSTSSSTISSCSMAQSIARQGQDGDTPLIVPRPLESTRLQDTRPRSSGRSTNRSSHHSSRGSAASADARDGRAAVPGRSAFDASSQFQTLTPEEDSSADTLT